MSDVFICDECLVEYPVSSNSGGDICHTCRARLGDAAYVEPEDGRAKEKKERMAADAAREKAEAEADFDREAEARRELADRELCRRRLLPFIKRFNPQYKAGWVHADICARLERFFADVESEKSPRLMLCLPPRHGKSEIGSRGFPAWALGKRGDWDVISSTYSGDLAKDFSRKVRGILTDPLYRGVFRTRLAQDSKAVERWSTSQGGGLVAAGVQGPITGRGAHIGIIDDPFKDRAEAESLANRQAVRDWYSSTFYTRLAPGGGILIINTRWHEDDLSGWLLKEMQAAEAEMAETGEWPEDADRWELVSYPAIAVEDEKFRKKGEALHPERYPLSSLKRIRRALLPRDWEALYQQSPTLDDGEFFTRGMFRFYKPSDRPPLEELTIYAAGDLAISTKQTADYTVFVVAGVDRKHNIWILDMRRGHWNSLGIINQMFEVQETWSPAIFGMEEGQIEMSISPFIERVEVERGTSLTYEPLRTRGQDKGVRARPIQGRMEQGRVFFPEVGSVDWVATLVTEMLKFPLGRNDDCVDAIAWIGQMLMMFTTKREEVVDNLPGWHKRIAHLVRGAKRKSAMSS
jgi:predicted phage terminase large subunit-like protein